MNYLSQMLRDCSKNKPSTFADISFPLMNEIENKLRSKTQSLRRRYKMRLTEREKMLRSADQSKQENSNSARGIKVFYNKADYDQINYLELYKTPNTQNEANNLVCIPKGRLEENDEEATYQIYQLLRKRKHIFKVQQVKRKLKSNQGRRGNWSRHRTAHLEKAIDREQDKIKMEDIQLLPQNEPSQSDDHNQSPEQIVQVSEPIDKIIVQKERSSVDQAQKKENSIESVQIEPAKEKVENKQECINQTKVQNQIVHKTQNQAQFVQPQIKQQDFGTI